MTDRTAGRGGWRAPLERALRAARAGRLPGLAGLFRWDRPLAAARAPGRLDVMGGIADYSGSLVLQLPLACAASAAVQANETGRIRVASVGPDPPDRVRVVRRPWRRVAELAEQPYEAARRQWAAPAEDAWAAYPLGVLLVLLRERLVDPSACRGLSVLVVSDVPEGKGVSSSAALEVSVMAALDALWDLRLPGAEWARLCQIAENEVVGAPCGVMDQMTAALGRAGALLALLCQPAEVQGFVAIPSALAVWGVDSGVRHAVSGSDYTSVRVAAFMGRRILADLAGLPVSGPDASGRVQIEDRRWNGFLANVAPEEWEERWAPRVPERLTGADFLRRYGGSPDPVTRVDPRRTYAVRRCAAHPIYEHARVRRFARLLGAAGEDEGARRELGRLMAESHASYSACGLGCEATDALVELVRRAGPQAGLYGAKITGGGSGGTVAVLGRADAGGAVEAVARRYAEAAGRGGAVFSGSSPGAAVLGPWNAWTIP